MINYIIGGTLLTFTGTNIINSIVLGTINRSYEITLGENPSNKSAPWLVIGFYSNEGRISKIPCS